MEPVIVIRAQSYGMALCVIFHSGYSSKVRNFSSRCLFTDLSVSDEDDYMKIREMPQDGFFAEICCWIIQVESRFHYFFLFFFFFVEEMVES